MTKKCNDPQCPCQDGDPCHYEDCGGTKAMTKPMSDERLKELEIVAERRDAEYPIFHLQQELSEACQEIRRLREEASDLRQAVGLMSTLAPTVVMNPENPLAMAAEVVDQNRAEVERLKEHGWSKFEEQYNIKRKLGNEVERLEEEIRRLRAESEDRKSRLDTSHLFVRGELDRVEDAYQESQKTLQNVRVQLNAKLTAHEKAMRLTIEEVNRLAIRFVDREAIIAPIRAQLEEK